MKRDFGIEVGKRLFLYGGRRKSESGGYGKNKGEITVEKMNLQPVHHDRGRFCGRPKKCGGGGWTLQAVMKDGKGTLRRQRIRTRGTGRADPCTGRRLFTGPGEIDQFCRGIAGIYLYQNSSCTLSEVRRNSFYA